METFCNARLALVFGFLGNFFSCLVYLAPSCTFYHIYRRRSTENYQAIPYCVALFSAMLMLYYAYLKGNAFILLTINSIGCGVEISYLIMFFIFANNHVRMKTGRLFIVFNGAAYILVILGTSMVSPPSQRLMVVGWICAAFSVCVFAAPLSIMRLVIQTQSVEYLPFSLSLCLTLCAVAWFFYGFFINDFFVAAPNILGFLLGAAQIILYVIYRNGPGNQEEASEMQNVTTSSAANHEETIEIVEQRVENSGIRDVEGAP